MALLLGTCQESWYHHWENCNHRSASRLPDQRPWPQHLRKNQEACPRMVAFHALNERESEDMARPRKGNTTAHNLTMCEASCAKHVYRQVIYGQGHAWPAVGHCTIIPLHLIISWSNARVVTNWSRHLGTHSMSGICIYIHQLECLTASHLYIFSYIKTMKGSTIIVCERLFWTIETIDDDWPTLVTNLLRRNLLPL